MELSALDRPDRIARLAQDRFDLVVVGGGIVGAGIAWDAALRGLSVALIDKGDFASGTSSKSSKLLHGGLRYLEQAEVGLVFESLAQRNRLFGDAPHLARKLDFMYPIFRSGRDKWFVIGAGLWLYDLLSHLTFPRGPWHRRLSAEAARVAEPSLKAEGLRTAYRYADGVTEDARLVIETLKSASAAGALALNYVEATGFEKDAAGRVVGVRVRDAGTGSQAQPFVVQAKRVFVAAGPWVDAMLKLDDPTAPRKLRPTKGVHLVTRAFVHDHAVVMRSVDPREKKPRVMFVIPWGGRTIIGTTDTDPDSGAAEGPVADAYLDQDVEASPEEVGYLLDAVNASFNTQLKERDVISAYAGWRPLIAPDEAGLTASSVSREHEVFETKSGVWAIAGGKLTAYRAMARQAVDAVVQSLGTGKTLSDSQVEERPLSGSETGEVSFETWVANLAAIHPAGLSAEATATLVRRYGSNWPALFDLIAADPRLATPLPGLDPASRWLVEVVYAVRAESALTPADFLMRRTRLFLLDQDQGLGALETVANAMADELAPARGWDTPARDEWVRHTTAAYREVVARGRAARKGAQEPRLEAG